MAWRVGTKVPINVYDGDRPVCQCQTAEDARLIVVSVNRNTERAAIEAQQDRNLLDERVSD
jgi:hypothetical protein